MMLKEQKEKVRAYQESQARLNSPKSSSHEVESVDSLIESDDVEDFGLCSCPIQCPGTCEVLKTHKKTGRSLQELFAERAKITPSIYEDSSSGSSCSSPYTEKRCFDCLDDEENESLTEKSKLCSVKESESLSVHVSQRDEDSPYLRSLLNSSEHFKRSKAANNDADDIETVSNTLPLLKGILEGKIMRFGKFSSNAYHPDYQGFDKDLQDTYDNESTDELEVPSRRVLQRTESLDSAGLSPFNQSVCSDLGATLGSSQPSSVGGMGMLLSFIV